MTRAGAGLCAVVLALAAGAACGRGDAIELVEWRASTDGRTIDLRLPGHLPATDRPGRWSVTTELVVPEAWRGRPLTLVVPVYHSRLEARVDGAPAERLDAVPGRADLAASRFAFRLPASPAPARTLELHGERKHYLDGDFSVAPRVSATAAGDPAYVAAQGFGQWTTRLAIGMIALLAFIYAASWWLDRRPANGWFALQATAACYILAGAFAGVPLLGSATLAFLPASLCAGLVAAAAFLHAHFGVGRLPRWLPASLSVCVALALVSWLEPLRREWAVAGWAVAFAAFGHVAWLLSRLLRDRRHFGDAVLFAIAWVTTLGPGSLDVWTLIGGWSPGVVLSPLGLSGYALLQVFVVTRDRVQRAKEVETLNVELRRQIADRSRELAEALAHTTSTVSPALETGAVVEGRYRVVRRLGAGGMGTVHEVERLTDGRRMALKVLTRHAAGDALARFAREAQVAAELDHPHLVSVADVGVSRTLGLYLVMELVEGGSLEGQRVRFGDPAWSLPLLGQIAEGVAAMHAAGVVHRDLKPANVLVSRTSPLTAKIADFGIAGLRGARDVDALADTAAGQLTAAGAFMGTPAYMAPELAHGAEQAGPPADVFAFGVMAHEMIVGRPPFSEPAVLAARRGVTPAAPAPLPGVVPELGELFSACLAWDPGARPSAAAVRDRLVTHG